MKAKKGLNIGSEIVKANWWINFDTGSLKKSKKKTIRMEGF